MSAYELDAVSKDYGKTVALEGVTLKITDGPTAIVGYSGAGKTTLLRLLAGLDRPSVGTIRFRDVPVTESNIRGLRRAATMLFQESVFFNQNVIDNVTYGIRIRGIGREEAARRAREKLAELRLEGFENRKATRLSGGEKQRVALARALVLEPEVLLLDEPTANLDPANATVIGEAIQRFAEKRLVVISTHNFSHVRRLTKWAVYLERGRVVEAGPTAELLDNPREEGTKRFINGLF